MRDSAGGAPRRSDHSVAGHPACARRHIHLGHHCERYRSGPQDHAGPTTGDQTIITSGLVEGERIVVDGQYKLQQNSKVHVNAPAQPSAVAKRE